MVLSSLTRVGLLQTCRRNIVFFLFFFVKVDKVLNLVEQYKGQIYFSEKFEVFFKKGVVRLKKLLSSCS